MEQTGKTRETGSLSQQFAELRDKFQSFEKELKNWQAPKTTSDTVKECLRKINRVLTRLEEARDQRELLNHYIKLATEGGGRGMLFLSKEDKMKSWKGQAANEFGKIFEASHPNNPVVRAHKERRIIAFSDPRPGTFEEYDPAGAVEAACIPLAFGSEVPAVLYLDSRERLDLEWLGLLTHLACFHMRSRLADSQTLAQESEEKIADASPLAREKVKPAEDRVPTPKASKPVPEEASSVIDQEAQEEPGLIEAEETIPVETSTTVPEEATAEPPQKSSEPPAPMPPRTDRPETSEESPDSARAESSLAEEIERLGKFGPDTSEATSQTALEEPELEEPELEEPEEEVELEAEADQLDQKEKPDDQEVKQEVKDEELEELEAEPAEELKEEIEDEPAEEEREETQKKASMLEEYLRSIVQGATKTPEPKSAPEVAEEADEEKQASSEKKSLEETKKEPEKTEVASERESAVKSEEEDEEGSVHEDARRFARLLVSEIKLYNEDSVKEGRESGNLYAHLRRDIERSRDMYEKRVHPEVKESRDYFHEELIRILAENDETLMGPGYPGSTQT